MDRKDWIEIIGTGLLFAGGIYAFGNFTARLNGLENRVSKLETEAMPGTKLGDLCLKLMDAQAMAYRTHDGETTKQIDGQLNRLGCYNDVPAAAMVNNEALGDGNTIQKP